MMDYATVGVQMRPSPAMLRPRLWPDRGSLVNGLVLRTFRNSDPPWLAAIWNESALGRGAVSAIGPSDLDALVFSKPYFEPQGLIVACDDERPIGFAHAGFGADDDETAITQRWGVIAALIVLPEFRRRHIGRALLQTAEQYLVDRGAEVLYAGGMRPLNPFYLGLYGGAELPGFLESDPDASPFFQACGYDEADRCIVLQRRLGAGAILDRRFTALRRAYALHVNPAGDHLSWWSACVMGPIEPWNMVLVPRTGGPPVASARCWEMSTFARSTGIRTVGITDVHVSARHRRQGIGKLLIAETLTCLAQDGVRRVEVQTMLRNSAAMGLYRSVGLEEVDQGVIYRRE